MRIFRSNRFNRLVYFLWAPIYDFLIGRKIFQGARRRAHGALSVQRGERVLLVGVGTGADFPFLPEGVVAVGVDLSAAMLAKARRKLPVDGCEVSLESGDAARLAFADETFDVAILSLIVSVASDGAACLAEALRVTRRGGRILVFDKFLPRGCKPGLLRKVGNLMINLAGTDINRAFEPMIVGLPCRVVSDEPVLFGGSYRAIVLEKTAPGEED